MNANVKEAVETMDDRMRDDMVDTLIQLVRIPSVTGKEGEVQQFIRKLYENTGVEVHSRVAEKPKLKNYPAFCYSDNLL